MALPFYDTEIAAASARHNVPADLIRSVIQVESSGNRYAVGTSGEKGLMQIMDGTARDLGLNNPFDPAENIDAGTKYLSQLYNKSGNWREAVARYNGGKYFGGSQAQGYADKVIDTYIKGGGDSSGLESVGGGSRFKGNMCINGTCSNDDRAGKAGGVGDESGDTQSIGALDGGLDGIDGSPDIPEWLKAIINWITGHALKLSIILMAVLITIFGIWRLINAK